MASVASQGREADRVEGPQTNTVITLREHLEELGVSLRIKGLNEQLGHERKT